MTYIRPERPSSALDTFVVKGRGTDSVSRGSSPVKGRGTDSISRGSSPVPQSRITRVSTAPVARRTRIRPSTADGYGNRDTHVERQTAFAAHAARLLGNLSDSD